MRLGQIHRSTSHGVFKTVQIENTGSSPVPATMPKLGGYELKLSHNVPVVTNGIANAMYVPQNDGATGRKDRN